MSSLVQNSSDLKAFSSECAAGHGEALRLLPPAASASWLATSDELPAELPPDTNEASIESSWEASLESLALPASSVVLRIEA
jgi:hypothetical protein